MLYCCVVFFNVWIFVLYFSACGTCFGIFYYIFLLWNVLWYFVLYVSVCGTRTGILFYFFPCVELVLFFCIIFFRVRNALWYFELYFVQKCLPPTVKQPWDFKSPMPPVTVESVLNQRRQLTRHISTFPKQNVQTRQFESTALFERSPFRNKQVYL